MRFFVRLCVCMCVCVFASVCVHDSLCVIVCLCVCACMCTCMSAFVFTSVFVSIATIFSQVLCVFFTIIKVLSLNSNFVFFLMTHVRTFFEGLQNLAKNNSLK